MRCLFSKLKEQGFSGVLDQGETFELVGVLNKRAASIAVYNYEFNNPENNHGNHRIVILDHTCNYLGSYAVNDGALRVQGDTIIFHDTGIPGNTIEISKNSLPRTVWLDGEVSTLFR